MAKEQLLDAEYQALMQQIGSLSIGESITEKGASISTPPSITSPPVKYDTNALCCSENDKNGVNLRENERENAEERRRKKKNTKEKAVCRAEGNSSKWAEWTKSQKRQPQTQTTEKKATSAEPSPAQPTPPSQFVFGQKVTLSFSKPTKPLSGNPLTKQHQPKSQSESELVQDGGNTGISSRNSVDNSNHTREESEKMDKISLKAGTNENHKSKLQSINNMQAGLRENGGHAKIVGNHINNGTERKYTSSEKLLERKTPKDAPSTKASTTKTNPEHDVDSGSKTSTKGGSETATTPIQPESIQTTHSDDTHVISGSAHVVALTESRATSNPVGQWVTYCVLDTNVFMHHLDILDDAGRLRGIMLVVPAVVLYELDTWKQNPDVARSRAARQAIGWLRDRFAQKVPWLHADTSTGSVPVGRVADDWVLGCAQMYMTWGRCVLLTSDKMLQVKALSHHVPTEYPHIFFGLRRRLEIEHAAEVARSQALWAHTK